MTIYSLVRTLSGLPVTPPGSRGVSLPSTLQVPGLPDHPLNAGGSSQPSCPELSAWPQRCVSHSPVDHSSRTTACGHFEPDTFRGEFVIFLQNQPHLLCCESLEMAAPSCLTQDAWGHPRGPPPPSRRVPGTSESGHLPSPRLSSIPYPSMLVGISGLLRQPCNWSFCL